MIFDRIIEDALGFIRRFLWWRKDNETDSDRQPFQSMRTHTGDWGIISLVIGRDTPRAVRTWLYSPKRWGSSKTPQMVGSAPQDLHFYLDFLGPLPHVQTHAAVQERQAIAQKRKRGGVILTHRLQIFKASHFLNPDGFYDCELVYWSDCDFYLPSMVDPKRGAMLVLDKLVISCLKMTDPLSLSSEDWEKQLNKILHEVKDGTGHRVGQRSVSAR